MSDPREQDIESPLEADEAEATEHGDELESLRAEIENLRAEKQALYEKLARAQADFQNSQRRIEKEMDQRLKVAAGAFVRDFLPVLDNLERAMEVPETSDVQSVLEGVRSIYDQWLEVLTQNGVTQIAPEPGTPFDPTHMEALMREPGEYEGPSVTRLFQRGYEFDGRVIRPAQVAVSQPS